MRHRRRGCEQGFDPGYVGRHIHPHAIVVHPGDGNAEAVFQRTELLEFLGRLERRHREFDQPQQGLVPEAVDAQMLLERVAGQLFG